MKRRNHERVRIDNVHERKPLAFKRQADAAEHRAYFADDDFQFILLPGGRKYVARLERRAGFFRELSKKFKMIYIKPTGRGAKKTFVLPSEYNSNVD